MHVVYKLLSSQGLMVAHEYKAYINIFCHNFKTMLVLQSFLETKYCNKIIMCSNEDLKCSTLKVISLVL